jgi:hypothetical protein
MVVDTRNPAGVRVDSAYLAMPSTRFPNAIIMHI